ncbi:hypothetical protein Fmac_011527 [Flemingia macrophylla]|uniref:PHD finger protein ALFIN-LIKE n=1 Tax=Flemingia macrophylla TaxID=520843 RepID=A0ABD1MN24_9FABA
MASTPRTVEEIFRDYSARRTGIIRALTHDVYEFYGLCDPGKDNLCLYGHSNETWEVSLPSAEVPPALPEPTLGINFARDDLSRKDWLSLVAVHSDAWLFGMAFYCGARLNRNERKRLFCLINGLPTIFQVVTEMKPMDKPTVGSGSQSQGSTRRSGDGQSAQKFADEGYEEQIVILCGSCGGNYNPLEFWIGCDICEWWYHGRCVMLTPAKAETLKQYKCPSCHLRKGRY